MMDWITSNKVSLGAWLTEVVAFLNEHAQTLFDLVSLVLGSIIDGLLSAMLWFPPLVLVAIFAVAAYLLHRSIAPASF